MNLNVILLIIRVSTLQNESLNNEDKVIQFKSGIFYY